jgi:hypothetical protein
MALGDLQMSLIELKQSTLSEVVIRHLGWQRSKEDMLRQTRLLMWETRTKYLKKGKKLKPEDIFSLPGDVKVTKKMNKKDFQKLIDKWSN